MAEFTIYIGNKNYSSWSMRGWLMLKHTGTDFAEEVVPLEEANTRTSILRHSPSGKVPAPGDKIDLAEHRFEVLEANQRKVLRVRIRKQMKAVPTKR